MVNRVETIVKDFLNSVIRGDQMVPVLYYLPPSPPCRAILLLARMIDLKLDLKVINILEGEHMKQEFLDVSKLFICHMEACSDKSFY